MKTFQEIQQPVAEVDHSPSPEMIAGGVTAGLFLLGTVYVLRKRIAALWQKPQPTVLNIPEREAGDMTFVPGHHELSAEDLRKLEQGIAAKTAEAVVQIPVPEIEQKHVEAEGAAAESLQVQNAESAEVERRITLTPEQFIILAEIIDRQHIGYADLASVTRGLKSEVVDDFSYLLNKKLVKTDEKAGRGVYIFNEGDWELVMVTPKGKEIVANDPDLIKIFNFLVKKNAVGVEGEGMLAQFPKGLEDETRTLWEENQNLLIAGFVDDTNGSRKRDIILNPDTAIFAREKKKTGL